MNDVILWNPIYVNEFEYLIKEAKEKFGSKLVYIAPIEIHKIGLFDKNK